jgi:hypothetical protein
MAAKIGRPTDRAKRRMDGLMIGFVDDLDRRLESFAPY